MLNLEEEKSKFRFKMKLDVRWSDMDEMHHVNNAVYHTYTEQARIYYFHDTLQLDWTKASFILASAHIDYLKPLVFPSEAYVYLRCTKFGTKSFELQYLITMIEKGVETLCAAASTTLVMFDYKTNKTMVMPESIKEVISNYEILKP
jgi:acyl-CoA thioester hydrolase